MLSRYTAPAYFTRLTILSADSLLTFISILAALLLRFNFSWEQASPFVVSLVGVVMLIRIITFAWFRTYAVVVRYAGLSDIIQVFLAVTGGSIFLLGLSVVLRPQGIVMPLSVLTIDYFLLLTMMSSLRLSMPGLFAIFFNRDAQKVNVVIVGAEQAGAMTRNALRQDQEYNYQVVAFIDDNKDNDNKFLDGVPIVNSYNVTALLKKKAVEKAIFANEKMSAEQKNALVEVFLARNIAVLQIPFEGNWLEKGLASDQIRDIEISDLLERPAIMLEPENVRRELQDRTILVTGGAGSIGSELVRQIIMQQPRLLIVIDQAESPLVELDLECQEKHGFNKLLAIVADVTDIVRMEQIFSEYLPEVVFHAAAYKHVPIMERFPREAIRINVLGTQIIADLSRKYGTAKFVMISTDKAVNPTNVMGASKRIAEIYIQALNTISDTRFITTRFGNVLGSNGSVVPRFKEQIKKKGPVTVTDPNITRYFMTIPEASQLVLEAGSMGQGGEIYLFDMGEPVKIVDLAIKMIQLSGFKPFDEIPIHFTGLRQGEKLYEELLATNENSIETHHPKISRARVREHDFSEIVILVSQLIQLIEVNNDLAIVSAMKLIVPEYLSMNSRFETLDQQAH